ncbi:ead/Ea22-like family protein [Citrobacter sp. L55]|uniref:ead/Ea22-like family protein n=1 Tax=Citrobacter sp. L55 TaxID=1981983 RepID=UPI001FEE98C8|nr:ead/Ea22-like family protein [Citrobacter sp. L55]
MTALNKQSYRADGGDIGIGRLKEIADNAYSDEEKRWLAQRVLALLGELEKEKGYASAYEGEKWHYHQLAESEGERANREEAKLDAAEKRIAELEARDVNLPKRSVGEVMHMSGFSRDYAEGWCAGNDNAIHEIRAAGISVKGE